MALVKKDNHSLDTKTKKDFLTSVYTAILHKLNPALLPMFKKAINQLPATEIDAEWKAIQDGTVTKLLAVLLSGKMDEGDMGNLAQVWEGLAKPYFTQYKGVVPKEDLDWAHDSIKDFLDGLVNKHFSEDEIKKLAGKSPLLLGN